MPLRRFTIVAIYHAIERAEAYSPSFAVSRKLASLSTNPRS